MRNVSLLFSILSFTIFLFSVVMFFLTKDQAVVRFGLITTLLFVIATTVFNGLAIQSEEDKLKDDQARDRFEDHVWRRIEDTERSAFEDVANCNRSFESRLDSVWNEIESLRRDAPKRK